MNGNNNNKKGKFLGGELILYMVKNNALALISILHLVS